MTCRFPAVLAVLLARAALAADPAPDVPELKVLNHYVGRWTGELTTKPVGTVPGGTSKGSSQSEWVHDGRFVRQTWTLDGGPTFPKMSGSTMMTYDPGRKTYRGWTFFSNGHTSESTGTWDARTRTMTWSARDAHTGLTTTTTATFTADGTTEQWTIVEKDRAGKVVGDTSGTNTRKKE